GSGLGAETGSLTIEGPLDVGAYAAFGAFNPSAPAPITVNGSVSIQTNGWFNSYGPTIGGPVRATNPSALQILDTKIWGPVTINGGGGANPILGSVLGECYASSPTSCSAPNYPYNQNWLASDQILGWASITNYDGNWTGIVGNDMGPLVFSHNSLFAGAAIGFNTIYWLAVCSDNTSNGVLQAPNQGPDVSGPSVVHGPTLGNQAATCTGVPGGTFG